MFVRILLAGECMNPLVSEIAPKFRRFTQPMLDDIEFYVKNGTVGAKQIYPLLRAKFPEHPIHKKDLYNAIQKFKVGQKETVDNDAVNLYAIFMIKSKKILNGFLNFNYLKTKG
jgi:hypothetical protein